MKKIIFWFYDSRATSHSTSRLEESNSHCNFDLASNFMKSGVKLNGLTKEEEKIIKIS